MAKIQKAAPSFTLMDFANAGVAIRVINPIINPVNLCFFSLDTLLPPLLRVQFINSFSCANVKLKINPFDSPV